jgi:SAM-dependent methyltransferase
VKIEKVICEVCKSGDLTTVLDLGMHPLCDDLLEIGATETCEEFQIEIALCNHCLTAHQLHPVPKRKLFPTSYHYRSSMTQDVLNGMEGLVGRTKEKYGSLIGKKVVDIGCNDGSLLKFFRSEGAQVFGVEPTAAANDAEQAGIHVINDFFDVDVAVADFAKPFLGNLVDEVDMLLTPAPDVEQLTCVHGNVLVDVGHVAVALCFAHAVDLRLDAIDKLFGDTNCCHD